MTDPMDERLRQAARRWQADQPPPPRPPAERLLVQRSGPRRWVPAVGAVAVLVVAVSVTAALLPREGRHSPATNPSSPSTGSTGAASVVPWADLPATRPAVRTTLAPARPAPHAADGAPPCTADDLLATSIVGAGLGTTYAEIRLALVGPTACAVDGVPTVVATTANGTQVPGRPRVDDASYRHAVLISPQDQALLRVSWPSGCTLGTAGRANGSTLAISLPGGTLALDGFALATTCGPDSGGPLRSVGVEPYAPAVQTPAKVRTPYDGIVVDGDLSLHGAPGAVLTFTVFLTAQHDTPLDPCPDYSIWVGTAGGGRRSLNCAAVPYVDANGSPYLPAGRSVAFRMRLTVPDLRGEQKVLWVIEGPQSLPGTHGVLTIR